MGYDVEKGSTSDYIQYQEASVRNLFVRKVYGILLVQLIVTFLGVWASCSIVAYRSWLLNNYFLIMWISLIGMIAFMSVSFCKPDLFVKHPTNLLILGSFTLCEALLLSSFTAMFDSRIVLTAVIYTAIAVVGLTIFAATTKKDFISYQPMLLVACLILMMFGFTLFWLPFGTAIYAALGAIIFSMYLVIDTQMILGGKERNQFGVDDYIFASLMLYLDIINLFMFLLQLISSLSNRN